MRSRALLEPLYALADDWEKHGSAEQATELCAVLGDMLTSDMLTSGVWQAVECQMPAIGSLAASIGWINQLTEGPEE